MNLTEMQELFAKAVNFINARKYDEALRALDTVLIEEPGFCVGWNERAALLAKLNCHFDSICNYSVAITLNPKDAGLYNNRASSYQALNYFDKAMADYEKSQELNPKIPEVFDNVGILLRRLCKTEESIGYFRRAIELRPDYADAHLGLAMSLLELKQFDEGWKEFEWRWKTSQMVPRQLPYKIWTGQPSDGKALLLVAEQGHGDTIQFCRYAKAAKELYLGKVYIEVRPALARLMKNVEGIDGVICLGEQHPDDISHYINLLSIPAVVGTEKGFMGPYLRAGKDVSDYWAEMMEKLPVGVRVGLCWAGMNRAENQVASAIDQRRSLALSQLQSLVAVKGVTLISLQLGPPSEQIKSPPVGMTIIDCIRDAEDFYNTAALVDNLDLVITVDTSVTHLAAGLGKPTWMLSRFDGCWRWFGDQMRSPWYPTLRQYRQPKEGDWASVIEAVTRDLQRFVVAKRRQAA